MPEGDWEFRLGPLQARGSVGGVSQKQAMVFGLAAMICGTAIVITVLILIFG